MKAVNQYFDMGSGFRGVWPISRMWLGLLLCLLLGAGELCAADALGSKRMPLPAESELPESGEKQALSEFLDPEGRLVIPEGFSGSLDPGGLSLVSKPGEPPRFAAKNAVDDPARWDPQFGQAIGCDGRISAMAAFPDGRIVLAGEFSICGNVFVNRAAIWKPVTGAFESMGAGAANGVNNGVSALAIAGSDVYVGGLFTQAGGISANRVARFNLSEQRWFSLGTLDANGVNNGVSALAIAGGDVYVGGFFTQAGGISANRVARFNLSEQRWFSLGTLDANGVNNGVHALAITGTDVYVGGVFNQAGGVNANYVARFNVSEQRWFPLGTGASNGVSDPFLPPSLGSPIVAALAITADDVYVGGFFTYAGGGVANRVARFNVNEQRWFPLGTEASNGVSDGAFGFASRVSALAIVGSDVYVGGIFTHAGGVMANRVARFDTRTPQTWSSLGTGDTNGVSAANISTVNALAVAGSDVYVGGSFFQAGGSAANNVARFNSTQAWSSLGTGAANGLIGNSEMIFQFPMGVRAIVVAGSDVYVGGRFFQAGGVAANNVARFNINTQAWSSLGTGAANGVSSSLSSDIVVNALAIVGSDVYVGGFFTHAGGVQANRLARFNVSEQRWFSLGNGVNNGVFALSITGTDVYVGGVFTQADGVSANRVARFNVSEQRWFSLGAGAANGVNDSVFALAIMGTDVYAGGLFTQAGGVNANRVARFNVGEQRWLPLGTEASNGVSGGDFPVVNALAITGTDVYVGGSFTQAGGVNANYVARFNTITPQPWSPLSSGPANGVNNSVRALAIVGTDVYVGGNFMQAGGISANSVARFNTSTPQTWSSLGTGAANGVNSGVEALAIAAPLTPGSLDSDVYVGGSFTQAGPNISLRIARYDFRRNTNATITSSAGPTVTANTPITFTGSVAVTSFPNLPGAVDFLDNGVVIPGCANVALELSGQDTRRATCPISSLRVGSHSVVARYKGDTLNFIGTSDPVALTVTAPVFTYTPSGPDLPSGTFGVAGYQAGPITVSTAALTGVQAPVSYQVLPNAAALPPGLSPSASGDLLILGTPSAAGTYNFTVRATDSSSVGLGGPFVSERAYRIVIQKRSQTISFEPLVNRPLTAGPFTVTGTATSGLAVSFSSQTTGTCTVSGTTVTLVSAGSCTIRASQAGDANWAAAPSVDRSFTVLASAGVVLSSSGSPRVVNTPVTLTATITGVNPTGTVAFRDGGVVMAACASQSVSGTGNTRSATCTTSLLPQGLRQLTAVYSGDANNAGATSNQITQNVQRPTFGITPAGATLPSGSVGVAYGPVTFAAGGEGTVPPYSYFSDSALPAGLSLNESTGVLSGTPTEGGSFTVSIVVQDSSSKAVNGPFSSPVRNYNLVITSNVAPTLTYTPSTGTPVTLTGPGSLLGNPADGSVSITVAGGSGSGNATLGCNVSGGNFTLQGSPVGAINPGTTPVPIAVRCTRTAAVQNGSLSCTETSNPPGTQQSRVWPLVCPAASAVPPTLSYAPLPGTLVDFSTGPVGLQVNRTIAVTSSGAVGAGSTTLSCELQGTGSSAIVFVGGNPQTVTSSQGAVPLQLRCTLDAFLRTPQLSCTETDSPGGATRSRTWPLSCGPGVAAAQGRISVGRRLGLRNQVVVIPVSFSGDGQTDTMSAEFTFNKELLTVRPGSGSVVGAGGAECLRLPAPNDDRIRVRRSSTSPLPAAETKYCEVAFEVRGNAPLGAIALPVAESTCTGVGQPSRPCTQVDGRLAVAGLDPVPSEGANLVIAGYASTVNQERTLRVVNRGPASLQISSCAITPASGNLLQVVAPVSFPLSLVPTATGEVRVSCALPALGQERVGVLECATTDPMRGTMRYGLSCYTVPNGQPLPTAQLLDIEQRAGEQIGSSASRGSTPDGVLTVLGAPLGGAAGSGRVLVYGDDPGSTTSGTMLKVLASLSGPEQDAAKAAKNTGATSPRLGQSVALRSDGRQLAVGAPFDGPNGAGGPGRVYLYERPTNGWSSFDSRFDTPIVLEAPALPGGSPSEFGQSVGYTPNGDLVVGAPGSTSGVSGAGAVFVYARNGSTLDPPVSVTSANAVGNGRFGAVVAARNDQVVVGAPGEFTAAVRTGAAYRIPLQGGVPGAAVRITPTGALQANDRFGSAVAVTNSLLVIGASGSDASEGTDSGSAYLFRPSFGASGWAQEAQLLPVTGSGAGQELGTSVALSSDLILVGAPKADVGGVVDRGRVYGYAVKASYAATERPTSTMENAGGRANDEFGRSVVVGLGATVVGVPQADVSLSDNTLLNDVGRADGFLLEKLFADGFE